MADERILFELDEADLLAKLHLGGCETQKDAEFYNTGIVNMKKGATPEDPKGVSFDTSSGQYELGVLAPPFKVKFKNSPIDIISKSQAPDEKDEDGEDKKILDKSEPAERVELSAFFSDPDNAKALEDEIGRQRSLMLKNYIQPYVTTFAGEKAAAAVKEQDLVRVMLSEKSLKAESFKKYKDFEIPEWDEAEKKKFDEELQKEFDKDPKKKEIEYSNVCFKIGYSVEPME